MFAFGYDFLGRRFQSIRLIEQPPFIPFLPSPPPYAKGSSTPMAISGAEGVPFAATIIVRISAVPIQLIFNSSRIKSPTSCLELTVVDFSQFEYGFVIRLCQLLPQ